MVISGRTFAEYDETCRRLAQHVPVYIRGVGRYGDATHAGRFKAQMIDILGVVVFHEDDPTQMAIIRAACPNCRIVDARV